MGICLDTDQRNDRDPDEYEYGTYQQYGQFGQGGQGMGREQTGVGRPRPIGGAAGRGPTQAWEQEQDDHYPTTPPEGQFPMQNGGHIKFEVPKVPVIFVLGGPGSGKVTHCDNLMQERRGVTHINMTDLLQQYSVGNVYEFRPIVGCSGLSVAEMQDFAQLSSKTVTEVLMLEMKMAPSAKTYLVSGYPRSMRDVVEYSNKIQIVNGVILVAWRQKVLERQVEYGAKLGHVVLSLARMELDNFYRNVMPVADFFDQRQMLMAVNGERDPTEVYADFRAAVLHVLGTDMTSTLQPPTHGEWPAPSMDPAALPPTIPGAMPTDMPGGPPVGVPPVIWVIGGPGSNKSSLCQKAVRQAPGWAHVSVGRLLRQAAETTDPRQGGDAHLVRQSISSGEMVLPAFVMQLVESQLSTNSRAQGIVIDGFPRDMNQVLQFESKFKQQPPVLLLDCSKLQLGRGRLDDTVAAFRRRLELFRELTLPMLRTMDQENRLTIVDGDTDSKRVQDDFFRAVQGHMESLSTSSSAGGERHGLSMLPRAEMNYDSMLHDLEAEDEPVANGPRRITGGRAIANGVALGVNHAMHGPAGGANNGSLFGGAVNPPGRTRVPVQVLNGGYPQPGRPSRDTIRQMYADVEAYPVDSHM